MTIDIQVMLAFYLFMVLAVASNPEQKISSFKSQFMMVGMTVIGWVIFSLITIIITFLK